MTEEPDGLEFMTVGHLMSLVRRCNVKINGEFSGIFWRLLLLWLMLLSSIYRILKSGVKGKYKIKVL